MRALVLVPCSERKRFSPAMPMRAQTLPAGPLDLVARSWGLRAQNATPKLRPDRLYRGRTFLEGRKAAKCLGAELVVISAGYGLLSEQDEVAPYSLTVLPGKADSILGKVHHSEWLPSAWWRMLGEHTPAETDLCALLEQRKPNLILMSLSAGYALLIADQLQILTPDQKARLRIFCAGAGSHVPRVVADNIMPYDARLDGADSPIRGTMSDFSGRALHHYARCVRDGNIKGMNLAEDKTDLAALTANWAPPNKTCRIRQTDREIVAFILDTWCRTGGSSSASLRLLRQSGRACEQGRFRILFRQVANRRDAHQKNTA